MSEDLNAPLTESVKPEEGKALEPQTEANKSAEAEAQQAEATQTPEPETSTGGKGDAKPESRENARIRDLVQQRKLAEHRALEAERQAEALRQQFEASAGRAKDINPADVATYTKAVVGDAVAEAQQLFAKQAAEQASRAAQQHLDEEYQARVSEFRGKAQDFDQVTGNPNLTITPIMANAIKRSETGAAIAYYLGKNPAEARRIAVLDPFDQAAAIGELRSRVSLPERRTSSAPAPVKTVTGGTSAGSAAPNLEELSYEDYRKARMGKGA